MFRVLTAGFLFLLVASLVGAQASLAAAGSSSLRCGGAHADSSFVLNSILAKVQIPTGMNRPKVLLVTAHEDSEFQRAQKFFSKHGVVVWRVSEKDIRTIQNSSVPSESRFPLFGLLKMDSHIAMFSNVMEGNKWRSFWGGVPEWRMRYKDEDLSIFAYYYLLNPKITDNIHIKQNLRTPVDFANDPWRDYYKANPLLKPLQGTWIERMVISVMNQGLFHRSVDSARQRSMWLPGLNSGVPLTPRKDPLKEGVYALHNYLHWTSVDLIPLDLKRPELFDIYVTHRTMGEAITILLSDLFAADLIKKGSGMEPQDPSSWAIEPVFSELGIDPRDESPQNFHRIRELLKAHVVWSLRNDEQPLRKLFQEKGLPLEKLEAYFKRYRKMFDGDYFWSLKNAQAYREKEGELRHWWDYTQSVRSASEAQFMTVAEMKQKIANREGDLAEKIFDEIFENQLLPFMQHKTVSLEPEDVRRGRALSRYMTGQLAIVEQFPNVPEVQTAAANIKIEIEKLNGVVSAEATRKIHGMYFRLLDHLFKKGLINDDDFAIFMSAYPLLPPTYVNTTGS